MQQKLTHCRYNIAIQRENVSRQNLHHPGAVIILLNNMLQLLHCSVVVGHSRRCEKVARKQVYDDVPIICCPHVILQSAAHNIGTMTILLLGTV